MITSALDTAKHSIATFFILPEHHQWNPKSCGLLSLKVPLSNNCAWLCYLGLTWLCHDGSVGAQAEAKEANTLWHICTSCGLAGSGFSTHFIRSQHPQSLISNQNNDCRLQSTQSCTNRGSLTCSCCMRASSSCFSCSPAATCCVAESARMLRRATSSSSHF